MLSIVILVCDKDFHFLDELLLSIFNKVHIKKEVVILDNRNNQESAISYKGVRVFSQQKNIGQYEGRLWVSQFCKGDYLWFIDADDEIYEILDSYTTYMSADLIHFNSKTKTSLQTRRHISADKKSMFLKDIKHKQFKLEEDVDFLFWNTCKCALWSFWIKTDIFNKATKILPRNKNYKHGEDIFVLSTLFNLSKTISLVQEYIYCHNYINSSYNLKSFKSMSYLLKDFPDMLFHAKTILKDKFLSYFEPIDNYNSGIDFLKKIKEEKDFEEGAKFVYKIFGDNLFEAINNTNLDDEFLTKLKKIFGNKISKYKTLWEQKTISINEKLKKEYKSSCCTNSIKPFISIVIPFIDRDIYTISALIQNIYNRIPFSKEILLIDNRVSEVDVGLNLLGAKVISKGKNLAQFESKRLAILKAKGEYVWFVDSDDDILPIDINQAYLSQYDLICFDFCDCNIDGVMGEPKRKNRIFGDFGGKYTERFVSKTSVQTLKNIGGVFTWNKWFKREILVKIANLMPSNKEIIIAEDELWVTSFYENSEKVLFTEDMLYIHHVDSGLTSNCEFQLENFYKLITGWDSLKLISQSVLTRTGYLSLRINTCRFLIKKIADINKYSDIKEAYKELKKMFSVDEINQSIMYDFYYWELKNWAVAKFNLFEIEDKIQWVVKQTHPLNF